MEKQKLRGLLETLHQDLSQSDGIDADSEALLRTVLADIQRLLQGDAEGPRPGEAAAGGVAESAADDDDESHSLTGRLQDVVRQLESDHPQIASLVTSVSEALRNLGI